jgi:hypothetical protein
MSKLVAVYNGFFCDSLGSFVYPRSSPSDDVLRRSLQVVGQERLRGYLQVVLSFLRAELL